MIKTKVTFSEGLLLSSQSEQFNWLDKKPALQKSHFWFDRVNKLNTNYFYETGNKKNKQLFSA